MAARILSEQHKIEIYELLKQFKTYKEIGDLYGVSRERIRQLARTQNLQGLGISKRREQRIKDIDERLSRKYGDFYKDGIVDKSDFLEVCKQKFTNKRRSAYQHLWTVEFCDIKWNTHCPILGIELDYFAESRQENSPSFDRIDPTKGYVPGNVQIVSWRANRIKNDGTSEEHYKIAEFLKKLGY